MIAWELGNNFGHLLRDLEIARLLREIGHQVIFVVCDTRIASLILTPNRFTYLQAPRTVITNYKNRNPAVNYSDLLLHLGWNDSESVHGAISAWKNIYLLTKPDIIIADHAPTAIFTALLLKIPYSLLGTGFEIPPESQPLPPFFPLNPDSQASAIFAEKKVLDTINTTCHRSRNKPVRQISEFFCTPRKILATFPELDHYGERLQTYYSGVFYGSEIGKTVEWFESTQTKVLVYLRSSVTNFRNILSSIKSLNYQAICCIPDISHEDETKLSSKTIKISREPLNLDKLTKTSDIAVGYGSLGFSSQCFQAGVPMILMPHVLEQVICSDRMEKAGIAIHLPAADRSFERCEHALQILVHDDKFKKASDFFAKKYSHYSKEHERHLAAKILINS